MISAYAATGAKILSWVIVLGLLYRRDVAEFAVLALIRGTIGILNYTSFGLSPAMIRLLSEAKRVQPASTQPAAADSVLPYEAPRHGEDGVAKLYANGLMIALLSGVVGLLAAAAYAVVFDDVYQMPDRLRPWMFTPVCLVGLGTVLRLMSDAPGSVLQANGQIARDNWRLVEAELTWTVLAGLSLGLRHRDVHLDSVAFWYAVSGAVLFYRRSSLAAGLTGLAFPRWRLIDEATIRRLLGFGALVLFAQLADYLYAPTDYILINLLIGWEAVATYTPAMTIDSGLLLLVTGLSSVILPRTAIAHTSGEIERVRRYYIWGTAFSAFLLLVAGLAVWLLSPLIFRLWLGQPMRATQAILPLVLIHTVVGGSSAVGRSILLGMGRVRAFTISVLIAGVMNVVLSYIFVRHLNLGLNGVVLGTIVVVVARAGVWMPWYVLRTLRREARAG